MAENKTDHFFAQPPKMSRCAAFKLFLWNSQTRQFLGRTGASWAKILLFYLLFYASLTALFFALFAIFLQTIDRDAPKWQLGESLIGSNPGLSIRPLPPDDKAETPFIKFFDDHKWKKDLDEFLTKYRAPAPAPGEERVACSFSAPPGPGQVCAVPFRSLGPCAAPALSPSAPCVFLKLNKIFNWQPEFYNDSESLPDKMPDDLKQHISNLSDASSVEVNTVWLSCAGKSLEDQKHMGDIQYFPGRGFPGYFFPFRNKRSLSPLVALWFKAPASGVLINIECKAWAKNIVHDRLDRRGYVHFQVMVK